MKNTVSCGRPPTVSPLLITIRTVPCVSAFFSHASGANRSPIPWKGGEIRRASRYTAICIPITQRPNLIFTLRILLQYVAISVRRVQAESLAIANENCCSPVDFAQGTPPVLLFQAAKRVPFEHADGTLIFHLLYTLQGRYDLQNATLRGSGFPEQTSLLEKVLWKA